VFTDKISGTRDDRPGLAALLDYAREGDTVVVVALDRLGRSLAGIVRTVETLREREVMLRSLREGIDYSTAVGRMVAGIFAALAEYERELIHERAAVARQAARARGKQTGRPRALTSDQIRLAHRMREAGESVSTICITLRVARSTLYRAFNDAEPAVAE
jgi:DNA invertase Pin-like site-specific DNA recombinase